MVRPRRNSPTIEQLEAAGYTFEALNLKPGKSHKYRALPVTACPDCLCIRAEVGEKNWCPACRKTELNWLHFDSTGEYRRFCELVLMEQTGIIRHLQRQLPIEIRINNRAVGKYVCDFVFNQDGKMVYEDFKGHDTPLSRFKRKCVEAMYDIQITLTGASNGNKQPSSN